MKIKKVKILTIFESSTALVNPSKERLNKIKEIILKIKILSKELNKLIK